MADEKVIRIRIDGSAARPGAQVVAVSLGDIAAAAVGAAASIFSVDKAINLFIGSLRKMVSTASESESVTKQLEAAVRSAGGAAGHSSKQLIDMANALSKVSTFSDEAIASAETVLVRFQKIGRDVLPQATKAVMDISIAMGRDLNAAALAVGKALNEPASALAALSRSGIQFTEDEKEAIKTLAEFGEQGKAQAIILARIQEQFGGAADAARNTFGGAIDTLHVSVDELYETAGNQLLPVLREITEELNKAARSEGVIKWFRDLGTVIGGLVSLLKGLSEGIDNLLSMLPKIPSVMDVLVPKLSTIAGVIDKIKGVFSGGTKFDAGNEASFAAAIKHWGEQAQQQGPPITAFYVTQAEHLAAVKKAQDDAAKAALAHAKALATLAENAKWMFLKPLEDKGDKQAKIDSAAFYTQAAEGVKKVIEQLKLEDKVKADMAKTDAENAAAFEKQQQDSLEALSKFKKGWHDYVLQPGLDAWDQTKAAGLDAMTAILTGGKVNFKELFKSILEMWVRTLLEMLQRWYAYQAATRISGAGASPQQGPTADGGNLSTATTVGSAAHTYGGMSYSSLAGYALIAYGLFVVYKAFIDKSETLFSGSATLGGGTTGGGTKKGADIARDMQKAITALVQNTTTLAKAMNLGLEELTAGSVTIGENKVGKHKVYFVKGMFDNVGQAFKTLEEAMDYAQVQALKYAKFSEQTSKLVAAVIHNTKATTTQQLSSDVDLARLIDSFGSDKASAEIKQFTAELDDMRERIRDLIPASEELTQAIANINAEEVKRWQTLRDQITGRQKTQAEEMADRQAQAQQFNAERAMRIADLQLQKLDLEAKIEAYNAHRKITEGTLDLAGGMGKGATYLMSVAGATDAYLEAMMSRLGALSDLITAIQNIAPIDLGEIRLPGGGGGSKNSDKDTLEGMLKDSARAWAQRNMGDAGKALDDINKKWDDAKKLAHGNAEELKKINEAREHEIALLRKQVEETYSHYLRNFGKSDFSAGISDFMKDLDEIPRSVMPNWEKAIVRERFLAEKLVEVTNRIKSFGGDFFPTAAIDDIHAQAAALHADLDALAQAAADSGKPIDALTLSIQHGLIDAAEKFRLDQFGSGILDTLYGYVKESEKYSAESLQHEKDKVTLQFAILEAQMKALGIWEQYQGLFNDALKAALDAAGGGGSRGPDWVWNGQEWVYSPRSAGEALDKLVEEFKAAQEAVRKFRDSLRLDDALSPLTPEQKLTEAQAQFQAIAQKALAGDVTSINAIPDAAKAFLEIARSFFASSAGYDQIFSYVDSILAQILQLQVPHMAEGGVVNRPTLALVGEAGPEAVVPIGRNSQWHANQMAANEDVKELVRETKKLHRTVATVLTRQAVTRRGR